VPNPCAWPRARCFDQSQSCFETARKDPPPETHTLPIHKPSLTQLETHTLPIHKPSLTHPRCTRLSCTHWLTPYTLHHGQAWLQMRRCYGRRASRACFSVLFGKGVVFVSCTRLQTMYRGEGPKRRTAIRVLPLGTALTGRRQCRFPGVHSPRHLVWRATIDLQLHDCSYFFGYGVFSCSSWTLYVCLLTHVLETSRLLTHSSTPHRETRTHYYNVGLPRLLCLATCFLHVLVLTSRHTSLVLFQTKKMKTTTIPLFCDLRMSTLKRVCVTGEFCLT